MITARIPFASRVLAAVAGAGLLATGAAAQGAPEMPAPSPKAKVEQRVGVTDFTVEYSSPGVKGREVFGDVVKYDELWRAGANAATKLTASRDFTFGGKPVKAGSYALYAIPTRGAWTVMLNTNANASGTQGYDAKNDVATITVTPQALKESRERMTFIFSNVADAAADLDLEWDDVRIRMPLTVDTKTHVAASIDKSLGDAWRPHFASARYLLETKGDMNKALSYADTSIAIQPTWWNNWIRAQILHEQGKNAEAVAAAKRAQELGKGDNVYEGFFKPQIQSAAADWND